MTSIQLVRNTRRAYGPSVFLCVTRLEARPLVQHPLWSHVYFCAPLKLNNKPSFPKWGFGSARDSGSRNPPTMLPTICMAHAATRFGSVNLEPGLRHAQFFFYSKELQRLSLFYYDVHIHCSLSFIPPAQRSCQNLSGSRTRLVRVTNTCLQFVGVPLCPFQHHPWFWLVGLLSSKTHQWTIYFRRLWFGSVHIS